MTTGNPNPKPELKPFPPAAVLGIGAVTPIGRDLPTIATRLSEPIEPAPLLRVSDGLLADPTVSRGLRRADRFVRMAAIAALDAWTQASSPSPGIPGEGRGEGLRKDRTAIETEKEPPPYPSPGVPGEGTRAGVAMERVGLIVTSGLGPHGRGFKFLDGILDCGDSNALPTDFSHSVHGVAASYIAGLLDLRGPSLSTTDFESGFEQAVLQAQCWLNSGTCLRVLLGAVEELGEVLIRCASRLLPANPPFALGEGAVFLTLGPSDAGGIAHLDATASTNDVGLLILDEPSLFPQSAFFPSPGVPGEGETFSGKSHAVAARYATTFSPYFGHTASNSAFQSLGGLLSLSAGRPLGRLIHSPSPQSPRPPFDNAMTFRTLCDRSASLLLTLTK